MSTKAQQIGGDFGSPLDYGGVFTLRNESGGPECVDLWEIVGLDECNRKDRRFEVWRHGYANEDPMHESWIDWPGIKSSRDVTDEQIQAMPNPERWVYVADYHGWHELDNYGPTLYTVDELRKCLGLDPDELPDPDWWDAE